jgi:Zn-dependent M28 family amino/carboxypeptidase
MMIVSGHQSPASTIAAAELVFVGYGIVAPEFNWNDFKGVDVKGKVIVVMNNDPEDDPNLFAGRARLWYGRWDYKFLQAKKVGAAGCLIIHTTPSAGYPWQVVQTSWAGQQFSLPSTAGGLELRGWLTEEASRKLVALSGLKLDALRAAAQRRDFRPVPLGVSLSTSWVNTITRTTSANVLGVLPGSDPDLKNEYVVLTAHHDHLGRKEGARPGEDSIYNGAVDNASGVAALLTIARALALSPVAPKRSVLFAAVAAEEQGLLGSEWLVAHSPVPLANIAADINIDGLNIWGRTRDVSVIGLGKSSLDSLITALALRQSRIIKPDALADRGFFYRSDQFNFARAGVPSAYFSSGQDFIGRPDGWGRAQREKWESTTYHQPSDELRDDWNFEGAVEDVQLDLQLAVEIANAPSKPTWNKGDEFEAVRLKSLREAGAGPSK